MRFWRRSIPDELQDSKEVFNAATIANRVMGCVNAPSLMQRVIDPGEL